ncbi:hypothetical protein GCM10027046_22000 [Uliginosibacterium flavum]|uniref:DUF2835 family protein n=1 Tax=Uliginosibacterium flavum TaxID=1396831 RepID=A0ABV2TLS5_9RHOO
MKHFDFRLDISPEQYLPYYRGRVTQVVIRLADGHTVSFPANLLRQFVQADGIRGDFTLSCDEQNKGATLQRKSGQ